MSVFTRSVTGARSRSAFARRAAASAVMLYGFAIEPVFFALGRPGIMLRLSVITAALNLVLIFFLVAEYGLIGAGMAALASTAVYVGLATFIALDKLKKPG